LKKAIEERDAARSQCARQKRMLGGAYGLLAAHGIDVNDPELMISEDNE
jgi:hypothetical protein